MEAYQRHEICMEHEERLARIETSFEFVKEDLDEIKGLILNANQKLEGLQLIKDSFSREQSKFSAYSSVLWLIIAGVSGGAITFVSKVLF